MIFLLVGLGLGFLAGVVVMDQVHIRVQKKHAEVMRRVIGLDTPERGDGGNSR